MDNIHLRNSFGSMSVDDYLNNIWGPDENQVTSLHRNHEASNTNCMGSQGNLYERSSNVIPNQIPRKTVDEVWSEIHKSQQNTNKQEAARNVSCHEAPQQQQTSGPMSLEAFLARAGVVEESPLLPAIPSLQITVTPSQNQNVTSSSNNPVDASFQLGQAMGFGFPLSSNGVGTYTQMRFPGPNLVIDTTDSDAAETAPSLTDKSEADNTKSAADNSMEMVVEKRQRRMLKNRESAARSRARRQAYTVELEAELNQLKQENEKLKRNLVEAEEKRKKEILERKISTKSQKGTEKLKKLRRTSSK